VLLCDVSLPGMDGVALLEHVKGIDPALSVVLMTGGPSVETASRAVALGAVDYLTKPVTADVLTRAVTDAAARRVAELRKLAGVALLAEAEASQHQRAVMGRDLSSALDHIQLALQPIVHAAGGRFGHEALLRTSEGAPLRGPADVFAAAETLDRVVDVGRVVRDQAAQIAAGLDARRNLFVNLHPAELEDDELYHADAPLSRAARRVVLEITERADLAEVPELVERLAALRQIGFRIAVDDLGAGYASLSALAMLEPEIVKIDISLIRDIDQSATRQAVVSAIIGLSQRLASPVVAEGVETEREKQMLTRLGCTLLQGYLLGRPEVTARPS